jgi:hypothetical protein
MRERDLKRYGFNLCNLHLNAPVHQTTLAYGYSQQTYTTQCFVILALASANRSHFDSATLELLLTRKRPRERMFNRRDNSRHRQPAVQRQ